MRMTIVLKGLVKGERIKKHSKHIFTLNLNTLWVLAARKM